MIVLFALTSALSAFLLFLIQPLIAKPLLPVLGGSPSVWNICMMTFQGLLVGGYFYAYLSSRYLSAARQSALHIAILLASLLLLPFGLQQASFDPLGHPQAWLVATLMMSVGLPYFLLSASAPMLQRWIAATDHPFASNPYPLYSASNLGSFFALFAYPLLVEPQFANAAQFGLFSTGYAVLAACFAGCVILLRRQGGPDFRLPRHTGSVVSRETLLRWLGLAFVPASLLYGVTTYITTDIASMPLLWVLPLMLYLLSFVFAFSHRWSAGDIWKKLFAFSAALAVMLSHSLDMVMEMGIPQLFAVLFVLLVFYLACFLLHRQLYESRPAPQSLPFFYVVLALGGALGGCFNSLLAPVIFRSALEFQLVLVIAILAVLLPMVKETPGRTRNMPRGPVAGFILSALGGIAWFQLFTGKEQESLEATLAAVLLGLGFFVCLMMISERFFGRRAALTVLALGLFGLSISGGMKNRLHIERNFFGISVVTKDTEKNVLKYAHGITVHGIQSLEEDKRLHPISYYVPLREVFAALPVAAREPVAVLGLGVGTIACYAQPEQKMDFYEIDPAPIRISQNAEWFTYMRDCPGERRIIFGDGRLKLREVEDGRYGLIIMDAFTSDAIPSHLLTREALTTYSTKLTADGAIAFNISNRFLDLLPVLSTLAQDLGWSGYFKRSQPKEGSLELPSLWVVLAMKAETLDDLFPASAGWAPIGEVKTGAQYLWTDQYTNLLGVLQF